jgi:hypothetical protein
MEDPIPGTSAFLFFLFFFAVILPAMESDHCISSHSVFFALYIIQPRERP